eukprot:7331553-Prymnesium_polylepis.1
MADAGGRVHGERDERRRRSDNRVLRFCRFKVTLKRRKTHRRGPPPDGGTEPRFSRRGGEAWGRSVQASSGDLRGRAMLGAFRKEATAS